MREVIVIDGLKSGHRGSWEAARKHLLARIKSEFTNLSHEDQEDAVSNAVKNFWTRRHEARDIGYLVAIARNCARDLTKDPAEAVAKGLANEKEKAPQKTPMQIKKARDLLDELETSGIVPHESLAHEEEEHQKWVLQRIKDFITPKEWAFVCGLLTFLSENSQIVWKGQFTAYALHVGEKPATIRKMWERIQRKVHDNLSLIQTE